MMNERIEWETPEIEAITETDSRADQADISGPQWGCRQRHPAEPLSVGASRAPRGTGRLDL